MILHMNLAQNSYDILVERGALRKASTLWNLSRRVLILTDKGVPAEYAQALAAQCLHPVICTVEEGEASKSMEGLSKVLQVMLEHGFSRKDCAVAVGGGVVGDLCGFAASVYMRGIDFYNVPTTLLSQIDSSIGGKTAVNFGGVKNVVGAFYQPKGVLIDPDLLQTLPPRQIQNGLAEAIKMALTSDQELFELLEQGKWQETPDKIILRSLKVKQAVVEQDEKEAGLRRVLNFGHTVGHGIETAMEGKLYHGECVALGLLPMCGQSIRPRVKCVLEQYGLYESLSYDWEKIAEAAFHDKKADGDRVSVIMVNEIGRFEIKTLPCLAVIDLAKACLKGENQ